MAKTEDIEAKLAAYVDGELDAAQRAEIEKHLAEHPKHRALMHELMGHKDLLKALPRQVAPADLAEAFTAQLERAVLLGDVDAGASRPPMRIGFFQQFRAVAAVLVLTVGLAALIYHLLPQTQGGNSPLADLRTAPVAPEAGVTLERDIAPGVADTPVALVPSTPIVVEPLRLEPGVLPTPIAQPEARSETAMAGTGERDASTNTPIAALDRAPQNTGAEPVTGAVADSMFRQMVGEQMKLSATTPQGQPTELITVVRAEDIQVANREVTQYLTSNNIKWEAQTEPMPPPLGLSDQQGALASRMVEQSVQLKTQGMGGGRGGRGASGGGGVGGGGLPANTGQSLPQDNNLAYSNQRVAVAGGDNVLVGERGPQRIVARQMPRGQAAQVVSDLNEMQSRGVLSKDAAANLRANRVGLAGGNNSLNQPSLLIPSDASKETTPALPPTERFDLARLNNSSRTDDAPTFPATSPSPLRLVPTDPFAFYALRHEPLSLILPTSQPTLESRVSGSDVGSTIRAPEPPDLVDVVILLQAETATEIPAPATQPTTTPAE